MTERFRVISLCGKELVGVVDGNDVARPAVVEALRDAGYIATEALRAPTDLSSTPGVCPRSQKRAEVGQSTKRDTVVRASIRP